MNYDELSMEELLVLIEGASVKLEEGNMPLEKTFELYKEAKSMLKACNEKIDRIEKRMIILEEEADEL